MKRLFLAIVVFVLLVLPTRTHAQSENPPNNSAWSEVIDANGNLLPSLTDLGEVQAPADWMPSIPGFSLPATYHQYQTASGNIVVLPSATTLFCMALNPQASGLTGAASSYWSGLSATSLIMTVLTTSGINFGQYNFASADQMAEAMISGQLPLVSFGAGDVFRILQQLINLSAEDMALYTAMLLYTPDMCNQVPGGCPEGADVPAPPAPPPNANECGNPSTNAGDITVTAQKTAPNNALVVGQDPNKIGVDLTWTVRVEPTTYTWWVKIPRYDWVCHERHTGDPAGDCKTTQSMWYNDGYLRQEVVGYSCEQHSQSYPEALTWATAYATLAQSSRDWILTGDLQIRYPGAYLHNPDFSFAGFAANGNFQGDTFVWTLSRAHVQVADPGWFSLDVAGATSGTAISDGRPFRLNGGTFPVYLEETAIIQ